MEEWETDDREDFVIQCGTNATVEIDSDIGGSRSRPHAFCKRRQTTATVAMLTPEFSADFGAQGGVEASAVACQAHQNDAGPFEGVGRLGHSCVEGPHLHGL